MMIKILVVLEVPVNGCTYHRQIVPHDHLQRMYPYNYDITTVHQADIDTPEKRYDLFVVADIVMFSRNILPVSQASDIIDQAHGLGCKIVFDIDDYWHLSPNHINYREMMLKKSWEPVIRNLQQCDIITTTTPELASHIYKYNKKVYIIPNAVDPSLPQWENNPTPSDRVRFGWVGSICHKEDIELMEKGIKMIWTDKKLNGRFQFVLGGFNMGEHIHERRMREDGAVFFQSTPRDPSLQTHVLFEKIFTDYYHFQYDDPDYYAWLQEYKAAVGFTFLYKSYRRLWAVDTYNYGKKYNDWDVSIIPLNDNVFNRSKSQLKIIESGFMGKAVICSNIPPYTHDIINNKNGMLVNQGDKKGWYYAIRDMIYDTSMREFHAKNLREHVIKNYHIDVVNQERNALYHLIVGKHVDKLVTAH